MKKENNRKYLKKLTIFSTVATLSLMTLPGCTHKNRTDDLEELNELTEQMDEYSEEKAEKKVIEEIRTALEQIEENTQENTTKIFEPYEHLLFVRVDTFIEKGIAEHISGGNINIPEGYKVIDIENYIVTERYSSQTGGYDIWFTNEVPVEVKSIYNESLGKYDYSNFGTPIEEKIKKK